MTEQASQQGDMKAGKRPSAAARRYALALFELCLEEKALTKVEKDLKVFSKLLASSKDLERLVKSPAFSSEEQLAALSAVFEKAGFKGIAANFIKLAAHNRRLFALPDMILAFNQRLADHRGEISADVRTAHALDKTQLEDLKKALKKSLGKDVALNVHVEPSLLGGLIVKVGSKMIDTSLRSKLNSLKFALKEVS